MSGDKRALLKQWLESGKARLHPLTFPQRELWEASPVPVTDMANHICCLINIRGLITPKDVELAIQQVVERQEVLRLSFLPGKGQAVQMIRDSGDASFRYRELTSAESEPAALEAIAQEIFAKPFDLVQGPLYRVEMLRRAADDHVLAFAIHHSIADGWTLGVFVQDLCIAYMQSRMGLHDPLPLPTMTYSAWGAAERGYWQPAEMEQRLGYWKPMLAGAPRLWPTLEGSVTAAGAHRRVVTHLPTDLSNAVRDLAKKSGATLYSTLLTAFQTALSKWTSKDDITVGTPVANRGKKAAHETMGYFAGIVPIRGHVDRERAFLESLKTVHETTVDAFANAMPFGELARAMGDDGKPGHNPLFEVRFALQNHPVPDVNISGLSARLTMRSTGTARYQLACEITEEGERLEVVWLHRPQIFPDAEVANLSQIYQTILANACNSPESSIASLLP